MNPIQEWSKQLKEAYLENDLLKIKIRDLKTYIQDYEKEALKQIQDLKFEIKNYEFENEFLKHKNRQYREEIYNYEMKKV